MLCSTSDLLKPREMTVPTAAQYQLLVRIYPCVCTVHSEEAGASYLRLVMAHYGNVKVGCFRVITQFCFSLASLFLYIFFSLQFLISLVVCADDLGLNHQNGNSIYVSCIYFQLGLNQQKLASISDASASFGR